MVDDDEEDDDGDDDDDDDDSLAQVSAEPCRSNREMDSIPCKGLRCK